MGNPKAKAAAKAAKAERRALRAAGTGKRSRLKRIRTGRKHQNGHSDGLPKTPTD